LKGIILLHDILELRWGGVVWGDLKLKAYCFWILLILILLTWRIWWAP